MDNRVSERVVETTANLVIKEGSTSHSMTGASLGIIRVRGEACRDRENKA